MHTLTLVETMAELLDTLFERIDRAERRVWIEVYVLRDDKLGTALAERVAAAARRGVDARILYDALGSKDAPRSFFDRLRREGVQVRAYRSLARSILERKVLPRDHGRIFVVDGCGYTTGAAFGDEWLPRRMGGEGWHDVSAAVEGAPADELARMFEMRWNEHRPKKGRSRKLSHSRQYGDVEILADAPADGLEILERYVERIERARARVWIENAYFFPPQLFLEALTRAIARGVDVRVIVPRITDLRTVRWAAWGEYEDWLERGVRIFEFLPRMLHSKAAVIDDDWATVGSLNVNVASLRWGNEVNLVVNEPRFVAETADALRRDLEACEEVLPGVHATRSWPFRMLCALASRVLRLYERRWLRLLQAPDRRSLLTASAEDVPGRASLTPASRPRTA